MFMFESGALCASSLNDAAAVQDLIPAFSSLARLTQNIRIPAAGFHKRSAAFTSFAGSDPGLHRLSKSHGLANTKYI